MIIRLDKSEFEKIENAFDVLIENSSTKSATEAIEKSLQTMFPKYKFMVVVVDPDANSQLFVMSVYPALTTTDRIIDAVLQRKEITAIKSLWRNNIDWTIEIDARILSSNMFTAKECTAMLMHEVGHIAMSDNIPEKISTVLRYELAKSSMAVKTSARSSVFRPLLALPILDACISDKGRTASSIREEIKADHFAKKLGYAKDLSSALTKLSKNTGLLSTPSINDQMAETAKFSLQNIEEFKARNANLVRKNISDVKESCSSPYIKQVLEEYLENVFEEVENGIELSGGRKLDRMYDIVERAEDEYVTEFFMFGPKYLKKIDSAQIDFIQAKINDIHNQNDKIMLVTYVYDKLDKVNYYLDILHSTDSKKYSIPHTEGELIAMKKRLEMLRNQIMEYKIPLQHRHLYVAWPDGYDG